MNLTNASTTSTSRPAASPNISELIYRDMNHHTTVWRLSDIEKHTQHHPLNTHTKHPIPSSPIPGPSLPLPRRTNSLALEKSDCHTCSQKQRNCDRKRRICGTCEALDDTCIGYPVRLQWQDSLISSKMQSTPAAPTPDPAPAPPPVAQPKGTASSSASQPTRTYKFVGDKPRKPRKPRKSKALQARGPVTNSERPHNNQLDLDQAVVPPQSHRTSHISHTTNQGIPGDGQYDSIMQDARRPSMDISDATGNYEAQYPINWEMLDMPLSNTSPPNMLDAFNFMSLPNELLDIPSFVIPPIEHGGLHFDLETIQDPIQIQRTRDEQNGGSHKGTDSPEGRRSTNVYQHEQSFLEGVSEQSTAVQSLSQSPPENQPVKPHFPPVSMTQDRFSVLLNMYDRVFCAYPITGDLEANPFRCRDDTSYGSSYLLHAILAMSIHHLGRQIGDTDMETESASHRDTALHLYLDALKGPVLHPDGLALLDSAVILFALGATKSAFGDWNDQLKRVVGLFEVFGGPEALRSSRRVRAQCAMFVWWDCTISLISRKSCIMNSSYFRVLSTYAGRDGWTWFDLVGCPLPLVGCLVELSDLVAEYEKTREMRWAKFDPSRVIAIQQFLRGWSDERFANIEEQDVDEEEMQLKRDGHMCTEAWRNAILIYIVRIFQNEDLPRSPHAMSYRSRVTLDCVRSCRKSTNVQKQLLLPVFLAACEASSADAKVWAKEYCTFWNEKSAYGMFDSVVSLLETIWARQTIEGKDKMWWGQVIDDKCSSTVQCLLG